MTSTLSARRIVALASVSIVALSLVSMLGAGSAVAADRVVVSEGFVREG